MVILIIDYSVVYFVNLPNNHLVYKMSESSDRCPAQFPKAKDDAFILLILFDKPPKTQRE